MFQFTGFASNTYLFSAGYLLRGGYPHSEIAGSKLVCQLADTYRRLPRFSTGVLVVHRRLFLSAAPMTSGSYVPSPLRDGHD
jgi:hypothetical protein